MNFSRLLLLLIPLLLILSTCQSPPGQSFITQDVTNFWWAYDQINTTSDTLLQAQYLQEHFLEPASPGLLALMEARRYTPAEYLDAIRRYHKFWHSLRANTEGSANAGTRNGENTAPKTCCSPFISTMMTTLPGSGKLNRICRF